ncbi:hypothetical protein XENOCAPTIV_013002 [Xenoophorus captivus]|uniref:Uncharacterized protein n=1 Tax=Xenoophorus captivus TaxID=1517983 RepID=A0ABV0SF17_9TELE
MRELQPEQSGEDDEEDQNLATRSKRSRAKKGTPEGFVRSELTSSDEEESIRGVKLPNYPTAPRKLQSIHNADILNNVYSEDETMSVADGTRARETSTFRTINQMSVNLLEAFTSSAGSQTSTPSKYLSQLMLTFFFHLNDFALLNSRAIFRPSICKHSTAAQGPLNAQ